MSELKNWWLVIVLSGCVVLCIGYLLKPEGHFRIKVSGKFLGPSYDVDIPQEWVTADFAQRHQEAYFNFASSLNQDE